MIAGLFCAACEKMADIYRQLGQPKKSADVLAKRRTMQQVIATHGWDGACFACAYDAFGRPIGSKQCKEGKIFIESQGWGVLGGVGLDDGRAVQALDSVRRHLVTSNGIILQQPAYAAYHQELGEISSYPPGYKENAGIFTHNNTWIQIAETLVGRGDRAYEYYLAVCPSAKESQIETYRCEPYVYAQMTAGPDARTPGEAKDSWLTGTASWSFVSISQHILGVRPGPQGLIVDPCIPATWKGYTVHRRFRGQMYHIHVANPRGVSRGVRTLLINGKPVSGNIISLSLAGKEIDVRVELGS